jgi:hypothetical protein
MPRSRPEVIGADVVLGLFAAAISMMVAKIFSASASSRSVSASTYQDPPSGSATFSDAGLSIEHLLGAQRDLGGLLGRQGQGLVERVGVQRVGPPEDCSQGLHGRAHHVVVRLLGRERHPGVWVWNRIHWASRATCAP